ncbi:HAD family phosphatase [Stigmatella sp. ncwal1]|uniref:HAD family phosphatase n=1 Tax=Stigmatella ashevillensis TaxID=2995309 RepID=A0ABT5D0D6_9BACT|nr:HAD family phosphatase [Stigmatella ashevillena]MDC0707130.1 HAD family phosphatase [Stigmatella ashevillena]
MSAARSRFSAVLFDMDGVLIHSKPVVEHSWRKVALSHGRHISDQEMHELVHGRPGSYTVNALFPNASAEEKQEIRNRVESIEERTPCASIAGVEKHIQSLAEYRIRFGLVTSGWQVRIEFVLQSLGLAGRFAVIVNRDDVSRGKPDPEPYLLAASRLGLPASETIVYEDSLSGVRSAAGAGAYCVGIGGEELLESGARTAVPDFTGITFQPRSPGEVAMRFPAGHELLMACSG